jgi:calcineurin-like phosphoesterase family protein
MALFVTADTHFSHAKMCEFVNADGSKVRPWDDVEEMDEALVEQWNKTVGPKDKVYHLGDVAIQRKGLSLLNRLNGD